MSGQGFERRDGESENVSGLVAQWAGRRLEVMRGHLDTLAEVLTTAGYPVEVNEHPLHGVVLWVRWERGSLSIRCVQHGDATGLAGRWWYAWSAQLPPLGPVSRPDWVVRQLTALAAAPPDTDRGEA